MVRIVVLGLKWLAITLVLAILAVLSLPWLPVASDSLTAGKSKRYLDEYATGFRLDDVPAGLSLPDSVYEARFVMLAEMHGFAKVQDVDLWMIQHLAARKGTRVYLAEINPAQAIAFNRMVLDGDDSAAREVFDQWAEASAQWANKNFFRKLRQITAYNAQLPDEQKIVFVGVDKLGDRRFAERMKALASPATPGFDSLNSLRAINSALLADSLERDDDASRYSNIIPNIEALMQLPGAGFESFYALWGLFHGSKETVNGFEPLAMRLNEVEGLKGKVATVTTVCLQDCFNMMPRQALPAFHGPNGEAYTLLPMDMTNPYFRRMRGAGDIINAMDNRGADVLLVPTAEDRTPYAKGAKLRGTSGYLDMLMPAFAYDAPAAEFTDAMIFLRNSRALEPWAGEAYDVSGQALALSQD